MPVDDSLAKGNLIYDTAIKYMQQPIPAPTQPQPVTKSNDDLFGEYVAGQLKLKDDQKSKILIKAKINNFFLMYQLEHHSPPQTPFTQNSQIHSQDLNFVPISSY